MGTDSIYFRGTTEPMPFLGEQGNTIGKQEDKTIFGDQGNKKIFQEQGNKNNAGIRRREQVGYI